MLQRKSGSAKETNAETQKRHVLIGSIFRSARRQNLLLRLVVDRRVQEHQAGHVSKIEWQILYLPLRHFGAHICAFRLKEGRHRGDSNLL